jgi:hypothetical protein
MSFNFPTGKGDFFTKEEEVTSNKIIVSWNSFPDVKYTAKATSYHGRGYNGKESTIDGTMMFNSDKRKSYATFTNLEPGTIYSISITTNDAGVKKHRAEGAVQVGMAGPNIGGPTNLLIVTKKAGKNITVIKNGKRKHFTVTEKGGGKHALHNMRLKYRMGVRRTVKKSRTAKRRQNGGVIFVGAPVNYNIPFGQRQPTEAIMERATTAGGKRKGSYRKRRGTRRNKRN